MKERTVTHGTFVIERTYPATPERVFAAFSDPAKKRRWFVADEEPASEEFEMDFRVGGVERKRFKVKIGFTLYEQHGLSGHRAQLPHRVRLHDERW